MKKKKEIVYLLIPLGVSLLLNAMYFSGNIVLQRIIVPNLPPLPIQDWREFGLLENLQHALIVGIIAATLCALYKKRWRWERMGFAVLLLGSLFMLLEEIDYGTIYYEYLTSNRDYHWFMPRSEWPPEVISQIPEVQSFSLHNQLDLTRPFKKIGDSLLILIFGIVPLAAWRMRSKWLAYLAPDRFAILTLIAIFFLRLMTHALGDWEALLFVQAGELHTNLGREMGAISKNLSEFRELNAYYLYFVHTVTLTFFRKSPAEQTGDNRE